MMIEDHDRQHYSHDAAEQQRKVAGREDQPPDDAAGQDGRGPFQIVAERALHQRGEPVELTISRHYSYSERVW